MSKKPKNPTVLHMAQQQSHVPALKENQRKAKHQRKRVSY